MNLCLYHKLRWLNSISIRSALHARNLGLILDNFLSLHPYILYITGLIDLTFKMDLDSFQGSLFPLSAFWSCLRPWSSHKWHGSLKSLPNYTSNCLSWSLPSIYFLDSSNDSVFQKLEFNHMSPLLKSFQWLPIAPETKPWIFTILSKKQSLNLTPFFGE